MLADLPAYSATDKGPLKFLMEASPTTMRPIMRRVRPDTSQVRSTPRHKPSNTP